LSELRAEIVVDFYYFDIKKKDMAKSLSKDWAEEMDKLRSIIDQTELIKTTKWGGEVYTINNGNVISINAFKQHVALWFFNGVFLNDEHKVLLNSQEGKTKAMRKWEFRSTEEIDEKRILQYINEAIKNEKEGKKWVPEKSEELVLPQELSDFLNKDVGLKSAFDALTPFKQKEYAEYIETAKREQTKQDRLEKIKPMILEGIGLNDKYRKAT
jgi:uncharacterized protein YdeI (YjbR/CyaY-like superfamily)